MLGAALSLCLQLRAEPVVRHFGIREGLANSFSLDLAIDNQGMVWVASENGLSRIAGDNFDNWNTGNSEILDDKVIRLYFDRSTNSLWCLSLNEGISILDCDTFTFSFFTEENGLLSNNLNAAFPAQDGGIWIVTDGHGIQHVDPATLAVRNYTPADCPGLDKDVRCCAEDRYGRLYIGYNRRGFAVMDLETRQVVNYAHIPGDPGSLPSDVVRSILIDSYGNVWAGTNRGLGLFDRISGKFHTFRHDAKDPNSLVGNNIFRLTEMSDHCLWVSSDLGGISVLDLQKDLHSPVFRRITDEDGLSSINIRCVEEDRYGNVWVANYASGVDMIMDNVSPFRVLPYYHVTRDSRQLNRIYAVCTDKQGNLWLGGQNELAMFRDNAFVRSWDLSPYLLQTYTVPYILHPDRDGRIWIGLNDEGVLRFDPGSGVFRRISSETQLFDVHAMHEDPDGQMWIGTEAGLYRAEGDALYLEDGYRKMDRLLCIYGLERDALGRLWVGTLGDGLFIFDRKGRVEAEFNVANGFCSDNINQIFKDAEGGFWVATYAGLVHFPDPADPGRMELFDGRNGLGDANVRAVMEDAMGGIWISTYGGISSLRRRERLFENFNHFSGIPTGSFVESSAARSADNLLYFGSPEGVCYFNPAESGAVQSVSPIHLVSCRKSIREGVEWLPVQIADGGQIVLRHDENTIRLAFCLEDQSQTERAEYAYRLPGVIDEWLSNGDRGQLVLWGLKPGTHRFQLRARLQDKNWEDAGILSLTIRVRPSVWGSWPARIVYGLLLAAILYFILRYLRLALSYRVEKENRRKEQDLNEERLRFFTNITHELRTPLTLILGPLEDLVHDKGLPEPYADRIAGIHRSGLRLHSLINQILEFRKTQTQTKRLVVRKGNLGELVESIGKRYREMNRNTATEIRLDVRDRCPDVYFDPDIVSTILENLMSNAVKYTLRGNVTLSLREEEIEGERYCTMSVQDTGYGIPETDIPQIFDRYYQVKGTHQASGTGIGLALVKALNDVHQGILRVSSREGRGSTFSFSILRDAVYPEAEHGSPDGKADPVVEKVAAAGPDETEDAVRSRPLILVVEDDVDILHYVSESLAPRYAVLTAENGREGFEIAVRRIPDMVISDIMMPEMDGIELCKRIKSDLRTSHVPVILLTAKDSLQDKEIGYESGADSYLTKPFTSRLLRSRVANLFDSRRRLARMLVGKGDGRPEGDGAVPDGLSGPDREFIERFDRLIEENLDKEDLDMGFLTASFHMSYSSFYRKVKGLTGITAKEFIRNRKLHKAMELLLTGKYNVNEVSMMTGYQDAGNFRNYFRKEFGVNPSEVLKNKNPQR